MAEVFRLTKGYEPELWAAVHSDQVLALMLPVRISLMSSFLLRHLSARSIVFGSVLVAPGPTAHEALSQLLTIYSKENRGRSLFTELRNLTDLQTLQPLLQRFKFGYQEHLNYLIDLARPKETLFRDIGSRTRKNIRHALNQGRVQVELITEKPRLAACYAILSQTYQNASVPLADKSLFEAAYDVLAPKGMVRFAIASVNGTPAAATVELVYKDVIFGWYGGVVRKFSSYVPNEILTWEVLKWGAENGYRLYDFGGAGRPDERYGVRDFKAKFGGRLVNYGRNTCVHSAFRFHLSKFGYKVLRSLLFGGRKRPVLLTADQQDVSAGPPLFTKDIM